MNYKHILLSCLILTAPATTTCSTLSKSPVLKGTILILTGLGIYKICESASKNKKEKTDSNKLAHTASLVLMGVGIAFLIHGVIKGK